MIRTICICGAGAMGSGIAQLFAQHGFVTILFDTDKIVLGKAKDGIQQSLRYLVDKQKISAGKREHIFNQLQFADDFHDCKADLVLEAIPENIQLKIDLFNRLAVINTQEVIFATNTSSLSVSEIQKNILYPERLVGMHFFNPAPVMKLVEVVTGDETLKEVVQAVCLLCEKLNKTPVLCKDAPGFIVNRVARQYYLEAMKLVENGITSAEKVDAVMEATGFKMGPFRLMDLIGMDINLAVSQSIYKALNEAERFRPSPLQIEKVKNNELGRKTGKGFYTYA